MFCKNCGAKLDENARFCSECGEKVGIAASNTVKRTDNSVKISCPVYPGQMFNNACIAYNDNTGAELARCKQGETLIFSLQTATPIRVVVKGSFGKPVEIMRPGERYKIGYRGLGKIYLAKVDVIS